MYKLFYSPGSCAMAIHVILNELGVPFTTQIVKLDGVQNRTPEFLQVNPRGQVPALLVGDKPMKEGGAMIAWLLEEHASPLLPKSGDDRRSAMEWLAWANASLHPAYGRAFWLNKVVKDEAQKAELMKVAAAQIQSYWDEAEERLSKNKYLAGDFLSGADILVSVIANWGVVTPNFGPNVKRLLKEVSSRPAWRKTIEEEGVEYKAAA